MDLDISVVFLGDTKVTTPNATVWGGRGERDEDVVYDDESAGSGHSVAA